MVGNRKPLIKSHTIATAAFRDGMREARRSQWPFPLASRATKQTARTSPVPLGCGKMRRLRRCAPRCRSAPRTRSRAAWCGPGRRRLRSITWSGACAAAPASGPWANESQPRYDFRHAPCIHPHFASNAIRGGLNQRFLTIRLQQSDFSLNLARLRIRFCRSPRADG